ncbi:hypothetical protein [Eubacterium coprostanoligenes]|uniref:Uncharacterized protein n=1 Tax=Eubacterium coprostanoligenes TaxID=290054 RepID=A0A1T4N7A6_9FIRM|nr:hypothetical protein [Eubacterium coprostanoligenes]SJZ75063.1 hypothetical protein SAMN02745114_01500 [Eubacterium coprostanoligenes]
MHEYQIGLALVKDIAANQKGLDERKNFIISKIKIFNEKSLRSTFNSKHIGLGENDENNIILTRTTLIITLYTQEELNTPGKAIRLLSQLLITSDEQDNLSDLLFNKKLFRTFKAASTNDINDNQEAIDLSNFSDSDLIKSIVDFVCDEKDFSNEKRNAIDKMKQIAIKCGLLH